jgi:hypothetical protein
VVADCHDGDAPPPHDLDRPATTVQRPHGWRPIVIDGIELFHLSAVPVTRYRWRATTIPSAWPTKTIEPAA